MQTLVELHEEMAELRRRISAAGQELAQATERLSWCEQQRKHRPRVHGDVDAIACSVLAVEGDWQSLAKSHNDARKAILDAIQHITNGGGGLRDKYVGCKSYDRWACQREDHPYGYGPRHGSIIASVGLCQDVRSRELTQAEITACVAYLDALLS